MAFLKRLGYYLIGLAIGLIFLAFFLKKKNAEFCYLPNCRVLKDIRSKPLTYSSTVTTQLDDTVLDSTDIAYLLREGDIDFRNSDTRAKPCKTYIIEGELKEKYVTLTLQNCDTVAIARNLEFRP